MLPTSWPKPSKSAVSRNVDGQYRRITFCEVNFQRLCRESYAARDAHLAGRVAAALMENVGEIFAEPTIERIDVLAAKPP